MIRRQQLPVILSHVLAAVVSLQLGVWYSLLQHDHERAMCAKRRAPDHVVVETVAGILPTTNTVLSNPSDRAMLTSSSSSSKFVSSNTEIFPPSIQELVVGGVRVDRNDFHKHFDHGFPLAGKKKQNINAHVLILYQSLDSLPTNYKTRNNSDNSDNSTFASWPLKQALENCETIRHVSMTMAPPGNADRNSQTCVALVGQTEADYVYKWAQTEEALEKGKTHLQFDSLSRYAFNQIEWNWVQTVPRPIKSTKVALENLQLYLQALPQALERLRPIATKVAQAGSALVQNHLMIMVTNFGHAGLFINFVCAARRVKMDLSKVLLFATDRETHELAQQLDIVSFYDEQLFASIPRDASASYGDRDYAKIMMSKVYCAHLIVELGFDFVFQDVDIIPYTSQYLEWFIQMSRESSAPQHQFDMYFQHDHNARAEYGPWATNSGCYYVKNNARTRYFFSDFIQRGDAIAHCRSHQATLSGLLVEHSNLYGLRTKTLWGDDEKLLIGWHFHRYADDVMKKLFQSNKTTAISFHMNWNAHKEEKREFLEQMGDWYLNPPCVGDKTLPEIEAAASQKESVIATCCSAQPLYKCHYEDRPSMYPCESTKKYSTKSKKTFW